MWRGNEGGKNGSLKKATPLSPMVTPLSAVCNIYHPRLVFPTGDTTKETPPRCIFFSPSFTFQNGKINPRKSRICKEAPDQEHQGRPGCPSYEDSQADHCKEGHRPRGWTDGRLHCRSRGVHFGRDSLSGGHQCSKGWQIQARQAP